MGPAAHEQARRWRNHSIHREVDRSHSRWVWKIALGVAIAVLPFAVYLLQTMRYVQSSYAIEDLRAKEARLAEGERRLRIDKATLEALPAVETRAARDLRLERPSPTRVVVISPGDLPPPRPGSARPR